MKFELKVSLLLAAFLSVACLMYSVIAADVYGPTKFYDDVSVASMTAVSNATTVKTTGGTYTNGTTNTFYYMVCYTNRKGRGPTGIVQTVVITNSTNTSAIDVQWRRKEAAQKYVVSKSWDGSTWTNWLTLSSSATNWTDTGNNTYTNSDFTNVFQTIIPAPGVPWAGTGDLAEVESNLDSVSGRVDIIEPNYFKLDSNNEAATGTTNTLHALVVNGLGSVVQYPLAVVNNITNTWTPMASLYGPHMPNASYAYMAIGKAASSRNSAAWNYNHTSDGSTNNSMSFGFNSVDDIFAVRADRRVGINTLLPTAALHIDGTLRVESNAVFNGDIDIGGNDVTNSDTIRAEEFVVDASGVFERLFFGNDSAGQAGAGAYWEFASATNTMQLGWYPGGGTPAADALSIDLANKQLTLYSYLNLSGSLATNSGTPTKIGDLVPWEFAKDWANSTNHSTVVETDQTNTLLYPLIVNDVVSGEDATAPSNFVTLAQLDARIPVQTEFFLIADGQGLTNSKASLSATNTQVEFVAATNNQKLLFWSTETNYISTFATGQKYGMTIWATANEEKTVGLQFEVYYSNAVDGAVEIIDGNEVLFTKKNVKTEMRMYGYPKVNTNVATSLIGVAMYVVDQAAKTPDITLWMEGADLSHMDAPQADVAATYLRVQGDNQMLADLNLGGYSIVSSDVVQVSSPSVGDMIRWDGTNWQATSGYVHRGDPSGYDYTNGWVMNSGWNDLSLATNHLGATVVPTGVIAVAVNIEINDGDAGAIFALRKNGQTNGYNAGALYTQVANISVQGDMTIAVDAERKIEYLGVAALTNAARVRLVVKGWWY